MAEGTWDSRLAYDLLEALRLATRSSWKRLLRAWLHVPAGILCVLAACWGVDRFIGLSPVSFPASVALLILLFFGLLGSQALLGDRKTRRIVAVIDVPGGFALRYINVFFTPSFVLLPLSPPISGIEVGKIIAVFLLGFIVMLATTAYLVRALQILLGTSKRTITERAEELGVENDSIPLTNPHSAASTTTLSAPSPSTDLLPAFPSPTQDHPNLRGLTLDQTINAEQPLPRPILYQNPLPLTRIQRWAAWVNLHLDPLTYAALFLFAGIPIYAATGYAMPIQLSLNILTYFAALALPPRYQRILHPVLLSSALTLLTIYLLALSTHHPLRAGLHAYSTHTSYLQLFHPAPSPPPAPGAGDLLSSALDASIVALALPMFRYRQELRRHAATIALPTLAVAIASLFGYPPLCRALGISPQRSLAFAARSLTLALATPATRNLGGDLNLVAVLCIMSGVLGVLLGPAVLRWLRIPEDDYLTRGVALGGNSSAIATALLLVSDPRAAALCSLSMGLFGTVMVALTSVPPIVRVVGGLAGLG